MQKATTRPRIFKTENEVERQITHIQGHASNAARQFGILPLPISHFFCTRIDAYKRHVQVLCRDSKWRKLTPDMYGKGDGTFEDYGRPR